MSYSEGLEEYQPFSLGIRLPHLDYVVGDHLEYLTNLCEKELKVRLENGKIPLEKKQIYEDRMRHELNVIDTLGFVDYFLIIHDLHCYLKSNKIPRNPSRGSAGGSLVLYLTDVTRIDPIEHELYFERMLSATRAQYTIVDGIRYIDPAGIMDQDSDVGKIERPQVLNYLNTRYAGKVAKIMTFGTLSGKVLIKEAGKIVGEKSEEDVQKIANLIPRIFGVVMDVEEAYKEVPEFTKWADENSKIYLVALQLRDLIKSKGVHPSGILVSYKSINEVVPLSRTKDGDLISNFDLNDSGEENIKLDLLGTTVSNVLDWVGQKIGIPMEEVDVNHPSIYEYLNDDICLENMEGLFQIESGLGSDTVRKVKPKNLAQLSDCLALGRPGAMAEIPRYVDYVKEGKLQSIHPNIDKILGKTANIIIYQESLMKVLHEAFGFSLVDADKIRKIVGKKLVDKIGEWEPKIIAAGKEKGLPESAISSVWQTALASAKYSFNASHSRSYAMVSAICIFYKKNYPYHFYSSLLNFSKYEPKPRETVAKITQEMSNTGILLLPPDITKKWYNFEVGDDGKSIRFGLSSIKGISDSAMEHLDSFIGTIYPTKIAAFSAAKSNKLNITVLTALIRSGCFDNFSKDRSLMVLEAKTLYKFNEKEQLWAARKASDHTNLVSLINCLKEITDEKKKKVLTDKRLETIRKTHREYRADYLLEKDNQKLVDWRWEKALLGYSHGGNLTEIFAGDFPGLKKIHAIQAEKEDGVITIIGFADEIFKKVSKAENKYLELKCIDETGSFKILFFNDAYELALQAAPKENDVILITGEKKNDIVFGKKIVVKDRSNKIKVEIGGEENNSIDKEEESDNIEE